MRKINNCVHNTQVKWNGGRVTGKPKRSRAFGSLPSACHVYLSSVAEMLSSRSLHTIMAFAKAWKELSGIILSSEVVAKKAFKLFSVGRFHSSTQPRTGTAAVRAVRVVTSAVSTAPSHNYWIRIALVESSATRDIFPYEVLFSTYCIYVDHFKGYKTIYFRDIIPYVALKWIQHTEVQNISQPPQFQTSGHQSAHRFCFVPKGSLVSCRALMHTTYGASASFFQRWLCTF